MEHEILFFNKRANLKKKLLSLLPIIFVLVQGESIVVCLLFQSTSSRFFLFGKISRTCKKQIQGELRKMSYKLRLIKNSISIKDKEFLDKSIYSNLLKTVIERAKN